MSFPKDFIWGAAASAYQIEGAAHEDGKGTHIWDIFSHEPGRTFNGHTGDVACDHYHRMRDDVQLMKQIGLKAYRFSISWTRVLPEGTGQINEKGLAFYDQLVDELLAVGIEPLPTLFHWDYPIALHNQGGWQDSRSPQWFAEYATVLARRLGDRVKTWMTLNEPNVFVGLAYGRGWHAPGLQLPLREHLIVAHHVMMAHGRAVTAIREHSKNPTKIGLAAAGLTFYPASDLPADIDAGRRALFSVATKRFWNTAWMSDPMILGRYPEDGIRLFGDDYPGFAEADLKVMSPSLDFYGINIYHGTAVRATAAGDEPVPHPPGRAFTPMDWPVTPEMLYWSAKLVQERYKLPIFVTENGMSNLDWEMLDGKVRDPQRIDYMHRHLQQLKRAMDEGVDVIGYLHWSLMDNYEWQLGYRQRFGLIYVDFEDLRRIPKDSAWWYRDIIAANGANL